MKRLAYSALFVAVAMASLAHADEAKTSHWSGESTLGFIWKNGNTKSETLNAKQKLVFNKDAWTNTLVLEASNSSSASSATNDKKERVDERYFASNQVDYLFSKRTYAFVRASWEKDRFSGFDYRANGVAGIGQQFVKNDKVDFKGEVGVGRSTDRITEDLTAVPPILEVRRSGTLGYLSEDLAWNMSKNAQLGQSIRYEYTNFNEHSQFDVYVKSMLVANISMKVAYTLRYNSDVPEGTRHKDEEVTVGVSYSF